MPFSYDIEPDESPRRRRHASRVESKQESKRIEVKALGPNIRSLARATTAVYDPNAEDGDGDGLVQDSTPFERPAALSNIAGIARGLASATGGSGTFSPSGSWTVGLSNAEVAERAVPDNPADFTAMMAASVMGYFPAIQSFPPFIEMMNIVSFDPDDVALLRRILKEKLDSTPQWRAAIDRFGMPPHAATRGQDNAVGTAAEDVAIFIEVDLVSAPPKPEVSLYGNRGYIHSQNMRLRWTAQTLTNQGMVDSLLPGKRDNSSTLIHEWGHYLNNIAAGSSDLDIRNTARDIREFDTFQPYGRLRDMATLRSGPGEGVAGYRELVAFINGAYDADRKGIEFGQEKPDDRSRVPWVGSLYGLSDPMEWFAEAVSAYFSTDEEHRAILNEAGARFVEAFLGMRDPRDISTPTQRMGLASTTGTAMRGMTPQQIADLVVPNTPEQARDLAIEHNEMLFDYDGNPYVGVSYSKLRELLPNGLKDIDFSPQAVEQMKALVVEALVNNPDFYEVVQRYGMPPVMVTRSDVGLDGSFGVSGVEGFPALIFSSEELQKALVNGVGNGMYEEDPRLRNTDRFLADPSVSGLFIHEWAHFLNRLAKDQHPDDETRALAQFWWSDTWEMDAYLPRMAKLLRRFVKAETRADARFMGAQKFGAAVASGKRVNFTRGYPHVMGQYGQSMPAEAFAEAVTAILSRNVNDRELVSPEMRRDVLDILDLAPTVRETQRAGMASRTGGSTPKTVTRGPNGVRIIDPNDPFTPLSGADWLKDATDAEIAEAVVPMNADDAMAMVLMNIAYGTDPSNFPREALVVRQLMDGLLFNVPLVDAQGNNILDQNGNPITHPVPYDFSPQGRQKAKAMVERMLGESPEFAWLVRNFGMPPMMLLDETQLAQTNQMLRATINANFPDSLTHPGIGGFSVGTLGVTMRPNADDNLPMGFNRGGVRKLRRNGTTERWMGNMGYSLADRAIHEWAHWFYWTVKGNKQIERSLVQNFGDRQARLRYLFPNMPYSQAEKMAGEFLDGFDAGGFIPFNQMTMPHYLQAMSQDILKKIQQNIPDRAAQLTAMTRFNQLLTDYINNVVGPGLWSPQAAQVFLFDIRREFPYIVDDLPPLIGGTYATATRQELWAEAVLLFCSPDTKLKQKYLHPEIEAWLAYSFGIKPDKDPSTPYQKPWAARGGLASSSRVRRLHAAEDSLPDRIADTNDGLASRTSGTPKATKSRMSKIASTSRFTMGDYDFDITDEDLRTYDWDTAYDQWTTWSGNWRMRNISSMMMGIEPQPTRGEEESLSTVHEIMRSGEIADAPSHVKDSIQEAVLNTYKAMEVIAVGETSSDRPLYRGLGSVPDDAEIMMVQPGETITLPLSAFTPDRQLANTFASMGEDPTGNKKVMIRLAPGAQVASSEYTTQISDWESGYVEVPIESVTQGEFRVVSKTESGGYTVIDIEHSKAFDPLAGKMTPVERRQGLASSSLRPRPKVSDSAIRMLEDNMEYLRDNPAVGRGGAELDDTWARSTIEKLKSGEINQDDALNLINAVIDILNNEFDKDPAKKDALDARLEAYQKLGKRLRRLVVSGMDEDDLDDFREEQGITRKTPTTGTRAPGGAGAYPGGRFGFGSRTGLASATSRGDVDMEKVTAQIQKRVDDLYAELEEKQSFYNRLRDCFEEFQKTGTWQGEKYNVFVTEGAEPKTVTNLSEDDIVQITAIVRRVLNQREQEGYRLRDEYDKQLAILDGLKNDKYPETTLRAEAILADEDMVREMTERSSVVRSMPITERIQTFTAPDGSRYVIHMGSAELKGGELDPARSRGVAGGPIGGNTRASNIGAHSARYGRLVNNLNESRKSRDRVKEVLSGRFRILNDDGTYRDEMRRFIPPMDTSEFIRIRDEQDGYVEVDLNKVLNDGRTWREAVQDELDNLDTEVKLYERDLEVYEKIKEDGWQVSSSYPAIKIEESWGAFGTYGGRYNDSGDDVSKFTDFTAEVRADEVGIHIFRVDDTNSVPGGLGETALVGKHRPIASLVVPRSLEKDIEKIFPAWVESAIKKNMESRRSGLASKGGSLEERAKKAGVSLDAFNDEEYDKDDVEWSSNDWSFSKTNKVMAGDVVVVRTTDDGKQQVLTISRVSGPFRGALALPGGLQDEGEDLYDTARREMMEEVSISPENATGEKILGQVETRDWDPRFVEGVRIAGVRYDITEEQSRVVKAGDDASKFDWVDVEELSTGKYPIAFGHASWLAEAFADDPVLGPRFEVLAEASRIRNQRLMKKIDEKRREAGVKEFGEMPDPSVPYSTERAGLASRSDAVLRQMPVSSMDLRDIPSLPTSYRDGEGPEPKMRQGLASMSERINEDIVGRFNPRVLRGKPFPGTETMPEVYVYEINGEKVVFGVEDRHNIDIGDAKNVPLNPYEIAKMERGTPESDELALKWAYAHIGSGTGDTINGTANSTEISALLYAAINGDEEARDLFEQYAEEGKRIVQGRRNEKIEETKQAAERIRESDDFKGNYREFVKKKLRVRLGRSPSEEEIDNEKIELKDIVVVRWTEHEPDYDEDGNVIFDTLSAYADVDRETLHFTLNHSVEEHMGWQQQGSGYLIMIPLSDFIEENGIESIGNLYGVDTYATPKPGQKLRLRAGATKVRYVGDDEASNRKQIANRMLIDDFGTFPVTADPGYVETRGFDQLITTMAADLGLPKGHLHANRGHSYLEAINNEGNYEGMRQNPLRNNYGVVMDSEILSDLDENSLLRHIDRKRGKPTGVSLYTRENKNRPRVARTGRRTGLASSSFSRGRNTTILKPEEDIPNAGIGFSSPDGRTQQRRVPLGNKVVSPVDGTERELNVTADSVKHVAEGGSLSDIPDEHLLKAIMENTQITDTDGRRFKIIGSRGGINGMVRLRDNTTGALIGHKYENGGGRGGADEALVEVMSEIVSGYFGYEPMPMRMIQGISLNSQLAPLSRGEPILSGVALVTELAHNRYAGDITAGTLGTASLTDQLSDISAEELVRLSLFDTLLRNGDRHGGNILLTNEGDKTSIIPIDQSLGFFYTSNPTAPLDVKGLKGEAANRLANFAHRLDTEEGRKEIVEAARKLLEELRSIDVDKMRSEINDAMEHFEALSGTLSLTRDKSIQQMFDRLEKIKNLTPEILAEAMMSRTGFRRPDPVRSYAPGPASGWNEAGDVV